MRLPTEKILILLVVLLLGAWIGMKLFAPKVMNETDIEETINIDTTSQKVDTTFTEKATPQKKIRAKKVIAKNPQNHSEPEKYDSVRSYTGTHNFDYGKFDWSIDTGGTLQGYTFTPSFEIPIITTEKIKTITQTRTIIQKGLFAGGGINTQSQFHIGATYLGNKFLVEYNFTPSYAINTASIPVNVHAVGFKYKVF